MQQGMPQTPSLRYVRAQIQQYACCVVLNAECVVDPSQQRRCNEDSHNEPQLSLPLHSVHQARMCMPWLQPQSAVQAMP